jgi:uncharacterized coiled-coil DUF342 family protein
LFFKTEMGGSDEQTTLVERIKMLEEENQKLKIELDTSRYDATHYRRLYDEAEQKLANSHENTAEVQKLQDECRFLNKMIGDIKAERDRYHADVDYYRRLSSEHSQKQRDRKASARPYDPYGADHPGWDVS